MVDHPELGLCFAGLKESTKNDTFNVCNVHYVPYVEVPGAPSTRIYPCEAKELIRVNALHLPSEVLPFVSESELVADVDSFIRTYLAVSEPYHQIIKYYVLFTYVYDRFSEVPYLRALGDLGTGKSRLLKTVRALCYRPIFSMGAISPAAIFRIIDMYSGTLILDEADFTDSDESHLIIKLLNTGYQSDFPILRAEAKGKGNRSFNVVGFNVFGPKILATRKLFKDQALESRCLTEQMDNKYREEIDITLPDSFWDDARHIRNKLLAWRLSVYNSVDKSQLNSLKQIHPRFAQIFGPLLCVVKEPAVREMLNQYISDQDRCLRESRLERQDGQVFMAILELRKSKEYKIHFKDIATEVNKQIDNQKFHLSAQLVGRIIKSDLALGDFKKRDVKGMYLDLTDPRFDKTATYLSEKFGLEQ